MAHFRGTVEGNRGQASRQGGKRSGLQTTAASWQGAVHVELYERDGVDWAVVSLARHHGNGTSRELYSGPVSGEDDSSESDKEATRLAEIAGG